MISTLRKFLLVCSAPALLSVSLIPAIADQEIQTGDNVILVDQKNRSEAERKSKGGRNETAKKRPHNKPDRELEEARQAVAAMRKKIEQLSREREQMATRIKAGDKAGAELDRQLAECRRAHERGHADLKKKLAAAQALAEREHQQAEKISAQVLEQVEAQRAIAKELKDAMQRIKKEREQMLAELKANKKPDVDANKHRQLIEENKKLADRLKDAWAESKENEELLDKRRDELVEMDKEKAELEKQQQARMEAFDDQMTKLQEKTEKLFQKHELAELEKAELAEELKDVTEEAMVKKEFIGVMEKQITELKRRVDDRGERIEKEMDRGIKTAAENERLKAELAREQVRRKNLEERLAQMKKLIKEAADAELREQAEARRKKEREAKLMNITPIYFGKNRAQSEEQERSLIKQVQEVHKQMPAARFKVIGHTCTDGTPAGNLALSKRRAQRIADLLKENGIPADHISEVTGKGQAEPQADNATQPGREANRRVEIKVQR